MCYSTGASGPTVLSVCSRLCLVANCSYTTPYSSSSPPRTVLYDAFYSYLCRRYWNGILGPSRIKPHGAYWFLKRHSPWICHLMPFNGRKYHLKLYQSDQGFLPLLCNALLFILTDLVKVSSDTV